MPTLDELTQLQMQQMSQPQGYGNPALPTVPGTPGTINAIGGGLEKLTGLAGDIIQTSRKNKKIKEMTEQADALKAALQPEINQAFQDYYTALKSGTDKDGVASSQLSAKLFELSAKAGVNPLLSDVSKNLFEMGGKLQKSASLVNINTGSQQAEVGQSSEVDPKTQAKYNKVANAMTAGFYLDNKNKEHSIENPKDFSKLLDTFNVVAADVPGLVKDFDTKYANKPWYDKAASWIGLGSNVKLGPTKLTAPPLTKTTEKQTTTIKTGGGAPTVSKPATPPAKPGSTLMFSKSENKYYYKDDKTGAYEPAQ